ncbi:uncharacterized protein N7503_003583 [Penicillium pulvis]|uniref:uncharacterized protein n=1 Tax=Penicillium pulvis TaxID=1562058 RepID=UPI002549B546|nr:uncharacterized protein N7503_003583 [Penicillium pulvis]KAJ5805981.1 hypothetical protein N7503_003583 [Penicillium pulvis]
MKVEKDSLIADLTAIEHLLEDIGQHTKGNKLWMTKLFIPLVISVIGLGSGIGLISAVAVISSGIVLYGPLKYLASTTILHYCKSQTLSIKESAETGRLEGKEPNNMMVPQFKLLGWINEIGV